MEVLWLVAIFILLCGGITGKRYLTDDTYEADGADDADEILEASQRGSHMAFVNGSSEIQIETTGRGNLVERDIYVDVNGKDGSNCGEFSTPCKSIDYAIRSRKATKLVLKPGGTHFVHRTIPLRTSIQIVGIQSPVITSLAQLIFSLKGNHITMEISNVMFVASARIIEYGDSKQQSTNITIDVYIRNTVFKRLTRESIYIWTGQNAGEVRLSIENCTFVDNILANVSQLSVSANHSTVVHISIKDSKFTNNVDFSSALLVYARGSYNKINVSIIASQFTSNLCYAPTTAFVTMGTYNVVNFTMMASKFTNNTSRHSSGGGNAFASFGNNNILRIAITNTSYINNSVGFGGGAISLYLKEVVKGNNVVLEVNKSVFENNYANTSGGALYAYNDMNNKMKVVISRCTFSNNTSQRGGAVYSTDHIIITSSYFIMNTGYLTASDIYLRARGAEMNVIKDCRFVNRVMNVFDGTSLTTFKNTSFKLFHGDVCPWCQQTIFMQHGSNVNLFPSINAECPHSYTMASYVTYKRHVDESSTVKRVEDLSIRCTVCTAGKYSIESSSFAWNTTTQTEKIKSVNCNQCPSGGNCQSGRIVSLPSYWGYSTGQKKLRFIRCPAGYCSSTPRRYNDCELNREGNLCGQCKPNHSLSMFSSKCIRNVKCSRIKYVLYIIVLSLPLLLFTSLLLSYELKDLAKSIWRKIKMLICRSQRIESKNSSTSVFTKIQSVFYFYQLQMLLDVIHPKAALTWAALQRILASIFNINLLQGENNWFEICLPSGVTPVHKHWIGILLWVYPMVLSGLLYFTIFICFKHAQYQTLKATIKSRLAVCVLQLSRLSFIPVATALFHLSYCVEIQDHKKVLFSQGDITCFQWWQSCVVIMIIIWVLPIPLSAYVGTVMLRTKQIRHFFLTILLPPTAFVFYSRYLYETYWKIYLVRRAERTCAENIYNSTTANGNISNIYDDTRFTPLLGHVTDTQPALSTVDEHEVRQHDDQTRRQRTRTTTEIYKMLSLLQGEYRHAYWPSVHILRHLLLVCLYIYSDYVLRRLYGIAVVLVFYQILLSWKKPFEDRVINWIETTSVCFLLLLVGISLLNATQLYNVDLTNDIRELLNILQIVKIILLCLPFPLLGMYCLVDSLTREPVAAYAPLRRQRSNTL